jgi:hypothetical protein
MTTQGAIVFPVMIRGMIEASASRTDSIKEVEFLCERRKRWQRCVVPLHHHVVEFRVRLLFAAGVGSHSRGRKLPPEASEFAAFLKTFLARRVGEDQ